MSPLAAQHERDMLAFRLDTLIAESERLESEHLAAGETNQARDMLCFTLELRLARRQLQAIAPGPVGAPDACGRRRPAARDEGTAAVDGSLRLVGGH